MQGKLFKGAVCLGKYGVLMLMKASRAFMLQAQHFVVTILWFENKEVEATLLV